MMPARYRVGCTGLAFVAALVVQVAGGCGSNDSGPSWSPPSLCSLPFEAGPCEAAIPVFSFQDGACVNRIYGGCDGNDNRFYTLEECMATCMGLPDPKGCPADRVRQSICLSCGPAGGCGLQAEVCARPCEVPTDCGAPLAWCREGACQVGACD